MKITIIGTGYVGLVTGASFAYMGNSVTCLDIDKEKINDLQKGLIPIYEPGLDKIIANAINNQNLSFSSDVKSAITNCNIIFIAVGTPMKKDGNPNLSYIFNASESIGKYIDKYKLIITKSTIPIGTTHKVKEIISNEILKRKKNIKFDICNNPEFLKEGKAVDDFMYPDRIIMGIENNKLKKTLHDLYKPFSINHEKIIFMDILSSELTKYASNAMLATKISFMNEMSNISEKLGADINKIRIGIGSDKRIGYSFIYPSVGYGGSCFPKDISSIIKLSEKNGYSPNILKSVVKVNTNQKKYFFNKILNQFSKSKKTLKNKKFGIWGLSFKPGTDDMRESPSIFVIKNIIKYGGTVSVYDPKSMRNAKEHYFKNNSSIEYCNKKYDVLDKSNALILLTEWPEFRSPNFKIIQSKLKSPIIFDGRNQYDKNFLKKMGFKYHQIGVLSD